MTSPASATINTIAHFATSKSALHGCRSCLIVLQRFKGTEYDSADWPEERNGPQPGIDDTQSMYAEAMCLPESDVKIALNFSHIYLISDVNQVEVFDTIMVKVGPQEELAPTEGIWEGDDTESMPPLLLTISTPRVILIPAEIWL